VVTRRQEIAVGVLLVGALALLAWMSVQIGALGTLGPRTTVSLRMPDAGGLQEGAEVKTAGVPIGRVEDLAYEGGQAVATLALDARITLPSDVLPRVRARSLLGEKYVDLQRPAAPATSDLVDGAVLVMAERPADLDDVISALAPVARAIDPEALTETLRALSSALQEDPERLSRILAQVDDLTRDAATAAEQLPDTLDRVDRALSSAESTLADVRGLAEEARSPLARADALLADADGMGTEVRAAVDEARGALAEIRTLLGDIDPNLRKVLANVAEIDKWELRRLLREEGILIRVRPRDVVPVGEDP